MIMVDEIPFPPQITASKPLSLLGYGEKSATFIKEINIKQFLSSMNKESFIRIFQEDDNIESDGGM